MSRGAGNIHRLAAVRQQLRHAASTGRCTLHPERHAVGYIDGWDRPKGCCKTCADYGEAHGYVVVRNDVPPAPQP